MEYIALHTDPHSPNIKGYTSHTHIAPTQFKKLSPHRRAFFFGTFAREILVASPAGFEPPVCAGKQTIAMGSGIEGMASPAGFEPTAPELGILCSIHLSYGDRPRRVLYHGRRRTQSHGCLEPGMDMFGGLKTGAELLILTVLIKRSAVPTGKPHDPPLTPTLLSLRCRSRLTDAIVL